MSAAITPASVAEKPQSYFRTHIRPMWQQWPVRLLVLAFAAEMFLPILVYLTPVPAAAENLVDVFAAAIVFLAVLYMLAHDRIPGVVIFVTGFTLIWSLVAFFEGQSIAATAWGWWKFFMYPLVGLFAYLTVRWPRGFADWVLKVFIGIMLLQLAVQVVQEVLGLGGVDDRAGTFGPKGVGPQNMFIWLVICFALGTWIATRRWKPLLLALVIGFASSLINGTKFFLPALAILGVVTLALQLISGGKLRQLFIFGFVAVALVAILFPTYNYFVADVGGGNRLETYFEPDRLEAYLFIDGDGARDGKYNLGRMLSVTYGLQIISRDPTTQLFGMGLGARSASDALGIMGIGLENDLYTRSQGTGLLTFIQEYGFVGMAIIWFFFLWLIWRLYRDTKAHNDQGIRSIEFGLIIFTILWPLWIWYHTPWAFGVMMILYWTMVGYVFSDMHRRDRRRQAATRAVTTVAQPTTLDASATPTYPQTTGDSSSAPSANGSARSYLL